MRVLRHRLARFAGAVLALQLCLIAGTPTVFYADLVTQDCTCPHGDGQMCPMHHTVTRSNHQQTCSFRSATNANAEAIATMLGPIAMLPTAVHLSHAMPFVTVSFVVTRPLDSASIPDAPPPRV
jgi:hypothetical protein